MQTTKKNVAIAEMLGAKQEQWYPENKVENTSGVYLSFPPSIYENENGTKYRWYPDNVKYHGEKFLKFHSDANWQYEALEFVNNVGFTYTLQNLKCQLKSNDGVHDLSAEAETSKLAVFNCLYLLSQVIKPKLL